MKRLEKCLEKALTVLYIATFTSKLERILL